MFDELQSYLLQVVPPQRAALVIDLAEAIAAAGITAHTHGITDILALAEDEDKFITLDSIDTLLDTTARDLLRNFGITLVDDVVAFNILSGLINGINNLDNFDDPASLLGIIEDGEEPAETLVELLDLTCDLTWVDLLLVLEDVKPVLINRIQERLSLQLANQAKQVTEYVEGDITEQRQRLGAFTQYRRDLLVLQAIHDGLRLGQDFHASYAPFTNLLLPLAPDRLATELLGFALASNVPSGQLRDVIGHALEELFVDINHITKVDGALQSLLAQVNHAQA